MRFTLKTLAGIAVCAATAASLTLLLRDGANIRLAAPVICIQTVIIAAMFWGRLSALIGAVVAGVTFALWLFPPYGHLWITDPAERITLTLFELAALCVVVLAPPARSHAPSNGESALGLLSFALKTRRLRSRPTRDAGGDEEVPPLD